MKRISKESIKEAIEALRHGGVVVFPTETSYGLSADATNARAVARVARLKGRPSEKTFPLIVSSTAMADRYAHLRCLGHRLAKKFWPGPLTLVVEARKNVGLARGIVARDGTVALRVSSNETARALARGLGRPIVSTSANRAGEPPAYDALDVTLKADFILDDGRLPRRKPSTIVHVVQGKIEVLRQGSVDPKA
ncbi:TPA: threonylcarbamoyl-AMP synthase [Candidatus Uhrbacteria bacterium]|uniref:L-threonylcarbamoyladenylate synthase n=1 Tax=Candidatus Uhrbacteria bacterium GW2011_GWC2_53_7 TaxID=1618986 RepID=A0A0G1Y030_9BACT|nr:MAG: Sua5/YciO/YrdC/YwlC family protein [Parcubacteria group bacterium GW2011_GWA2_53_21]KKW36576.1 MAG: Sua5/YciO/YrdC/YwlC family protein [Candidatus Uhrbacteria bacterium GW2011_GWC2_53_7]OGL72081.1 MAG: threonylcarbamoyl-AMP synthase [Candidatus Uhrbacteria bacterium RIFCSPHIGHO2_02_FULL_54_11]HBL39323.1 threonylcarbamoyl-AMP synthase [Candidatus Uhrbacteria bacterium]